MARRLEQIFHEASQLPENERAELAGMLLDSLEAEPDPDIEAAWSEEVERRIRQIDSGEVKLIPWEKVRADLFSRANDEG